VWSQGGFQLDGRLLPVLKYSVGESGWTDQLTALHENEAGSDHYIDIASREHALSRVRRYAGAGANVIDIGCSSGHMLKLLRERLPSARLIGADYIAGPLERLSRELPDVPFLQFDLTTCPLSDHFADCIIALNVLEHIEDHEAAVRHMHRILKPGGHAVIEVPAGPGLFDIYDRVLMHHRRYRMRELTAMFQAAGFQIVEKSHLGFFLYPAFWAVKKRNRRHLSASAEMQEQLVVKNMRQARRSALMNRVMAAEARLRDFVTYPAGIRCLIVARRSL
jgi:SAM-dependent methyltransferase